MAGYRRFFIDSIADLNVIEGEEFRHAVSVLRVKEGEKILLCDNSGYEYLALVKKINKKDLVAEVVEKQLNECECNEEVVLIAGYLKGDKTELIVQKATELGVKKIVVFSSEYSSAYMNDNKLERLNKVSVEAAKQCGRAVAPRVLYAEDFASALEYGAGCENKLFACEFASKGDAMPSKMQGSTAIVVGSEGGFSVEEGKVATAKGYQTIYLGKRILRAETACIALVAIAMNALGELK